MVTYQYEALRPFRGATHPLVLYKAEPLQSVPKGEEGEEGGVEILEHLRVKIKRLLVNCSMSKSLISIVLGIESEPV